MDINVAFKFSSFIFSDLILPSVETAIKQGLDGTVEEGGFKDCSIHGLLHQGYMCKFDNDENKANEALVSFVNSL